MSYQVDSYGNAYFPAGVSVASIPITTGTQAKVLVPGVNGRISSATVAQLITQSGGNLVSSVFGRTGVVTAQQGDYNTDQVTEGQAQYFSTSRARKSIFLTTFNTSGPATYDSGTGILNIPQYVSDSGSGTGGSYVPLTRTITINGQTADLSVDRAFSIDTIPYPSIGIPLSNGTSWGASITDNSANWNTAYGWGNHAGLYSLLGHTHTIANVTGLQTALDGKEPTIAAGTTAQYWRGDKSWQTLPIYTLAGLGGLPLAGGIMTGAITLKEGVGNGLKFPNDVFGGSGDTAGMRLITRSGESMSLEVYLTNDADDWFNISVPSDNGAKINGNTIWHTANLTNLNQLTNGPGYITSYTDTNTWDANTKTVAGYVAAPGAVANKVWKTDSNGNPAWRDDADTIVTSLAWTSITGRPTALSSFTNDLGNYGGWVVRSGDSMSGRLTIDSRNTTNIPLHVIGVEPYIQVEAVGASNTAGVAIYPTAGYDAAIGNFNGGSLNLIASGYTIAKVTRNTGVIFYVGTTGPITALGTNTSAYNIFVNASSGNKTWDISMYGNDWILNESNITSRLKVLAGGGVYADAFYEFSDKRFKTLIEENPTITNIDTITAKLYVKEGKQELGYYAQDFEGVLDSAILKDKDGILSLSYRQIHTAKIAALEKRIAELEAKLK